jgi:PPM family protein phosphatase
VARGSPKRLAAKFASISTIGSREKQEDSCVSFKFAADEVVFAVADGLGGHPNGEMASKRACDDLMVLWPRTTATDLFDNINRSVRSTGGCTTLTVCSVDLHPKGPRAPEGPTAHFAWAGDCVGMVLRPHSRRKQYTVVWQTPRHGHKGLVTRCLGGSSVEAFPQSHNIEVQAGDRILIVSDGFDEALGLDGAYPRNIDLALVKLFELQGKQALEWLERYTRLKGATDNATAVLVAIGNKGVRSDKHSME